MNEINEMNKNENEIKNELVLIKSVMPALINFNYEALEKNLNNKLVDFQNLIVTENNLKDAKKFKKELASLRNDLDAFRKTAKKEAEKPIKEFESKIKKLIALVEETEKPLDESINVYDEQVREEKRAYAKKLIQNAIDSYKLRPEYASRIILKDEYANLSATKKAVKESITKQAELLKQEQDAYDSNVNIIKTTIEQENKRTKVKLKSEKYIALIGNIDMAEIVSMIKEHSFDIYQQENSKDVAIDVTNLFLPNESVNFVGMPGLDGNETMIKIPDVTPTVPECFIVPAGLNVTNDAIPPVGITSAQEPGINTDSPTSISTSTPNKNDWKCVFEVTGNFDSLRELNSYMKKKNIHFVVISQEKNI